MNITIQDFWRLLGESRLLTQAQLQRLSSDFAQLKHKSQPTPRALAQWLMDHRALSKYQATVLLAGRAGPFFYGEYKVYERIDKGWPGGCFRAVHNPTKHPVLLRFLSGPVLADPRLWAAVSGNTAAAAAIVSPYVQRHFEAVDLQKFKFIVSEDVRGKGLDEKLAEGRLRPAEACRIMRLVALGLVEMHSQGRICGEVRLTSVVLEAAPNEPNVKLLYDAHQPPITIDFSQAAASEAFSARADYLAPELLTPGRPPDALADIYAIGCTLYALLSGTLPFAGGTVEQKLARHLSEPIKPLETFGIPQPLAQLVTYLMAKNPGVRYQSAAVVAEQLGMFVEPAAIRIQPPAEPPTLGAYEEALARRQGPGARNRESAVREPAPVFAAPPLPFPSSGESSAVTMPPPIIGASQPSRATTAAEILRRKKAQQRRNMLVVAALAGLLLIVGAAGAGVWWSKQKGTPQTAASPSAGATSPTGVQPTSTGTAAKTEPSTSAEGSATSTEESGASATAPKTTAAAGGVSQQVVPDDGKLLWASPTAGKPVTLRCVPPEGQLFLVVRPAAILASEEGRRVVAALGPALDAERKKFEGASGLKLEEIEQLTITLHNNDGKFPRTSFVVKMKEPATNEQLLTKWSNPAATKESGATYYTGSEWAYYIPDSPEDERTFAMGEVRDIKDVAAAAGAPPAIFREIERLRRMTDDQRHFSLLFYPQFLFNDDGEPLFAAERAKVRQPLSWLLGDQVQAASASGYLGDEFYFELRMRASLDKEPHTLAMELKDRLDKIPGLLEDYFVSLNPPPYWKKLAFRFPAMIRELHNQMRTGVDNETAMVNSVLPGAAAHNLVLGGELLVSTTPGQAVVATGPAPNSSGPKTIADALQLKTSFSFAQQSLEFAVVELQDDVKSNLKGAPFEFAIKIIGDDLKLDGITRNQSIRDFKQENQTVADILTALVRKANPVTTVKDPSETDQKLVWLIGPDPDNPAKQVVLVTTRNAAKTKKYTLPPVFVAKGK